MSFPPDLDHSEEELAAIVPLDQPVKGSTGQKYLLSVAAAMVAELVTFPLDLTKTRLQLVNAGAEGCRRGPSNRLAFSQRHRRRLRQYRVFSSNAGNRRRAGMLTYQLWVRRLNKRLWNGKRRYNHLLGSGRIPTASTA